MPPGVGYKTFDEDTLANQNVVSRTPSPVGAPTAAAAQPSGIRSATFATADGGSVPRLVREFRAKNRERQLIQGLPGRTSSFARRTQIRNAGVGAPLPSDRLTRAQRATAADATTGEQQRLRDRFAAEDASFQAGVQDITGRTDAAEQAALTREGQLAVQGAANQGALEKQDLAGQDAFALQNLREGGLGERLGTVEEGLGERLGTVEEGLASRLATSERSALERARLAEAGATERAQIGADPALISALSSQGLPGRELGLREAAVGREIESADKQVGLTKAAPIVESLSGGNREIANYVTSRLGDVEDLKGKSVDEITKIVADLALEGAGGTDVGITPYIPQGILGLFGAGREEVGPAGIREAGAPREAGTLRSLGSRIINPFGGFSSSDIIRDRPGGGTVVQEAGDLPAPLRRYLRDTRGG